MTTAKFNSAYISDEIIKERKPNYKRKQYMHKTPIRMSAEFIDQYMDQTKREKGYSKKHTDKLEEIQKK